VGEIPLYFYVPMARFFDGTDKENSKTQGRKGQIRRIKKKQGKKKERFFHRWRFPYSNVLLREGRICKRAVTSPTTY
jgi:hypothetical protein